MPRPHFVGDSARERGTSRGIINDITDDLSRQAGDVRAHEVID